MATLSNFADFLWILTKITVLLLVLLAVFSQIVLIFISAIFGRKQREEVDEEREE